jgi:hypothetical protein
MKIIPEPPSPLSAEDVRVVWPEVTEAVGAIDFADSVTLMAFIHGVALFGRMRVRIEGQYHGHEGVKVLAGLRKAERNVFVLGQKLGLTEVAVDRLLDHWRRKNN